MNKNTDSEERQFLQELMKSVETTVYSEKIERWRKLSRSISDLIFYLEHKFDIEQPESLILTTTYLKSLPAYIENNSDITRGLSIYAEGLKSKTNKNNE
mgnify:CR=1 FL=1